MALGWRGDWKWACPVWGGLGGNLPLRGDKAPSFDSMYVANTAPPRWLRHAIDHRSGKVLAYLQYDPLV